MLVVRIDKFVSTLAGDESGRTLHHDLLQNEEKK